MAKSKLTKSNLAHQRLANKHHNDIIYERDTEDSAIMKQYHLEVINKQKKMKRVLSKSERNNLFDEVLKYFGLFRTSRTRKL